MSDISSAIVDWLTTKAGKILIPKTLASAVFDATGKQVSEILKDHETKMDTMDSTVKSMDNNMAPKDHTHTFAAITEKPETYPPESHTHEFNAITGKPSAYPPESHSHNYDSITDKPSTFPPSSHSHTFAAITDKPSTYPPSSHSHAFNDITGRPSTYPPSSHSHSYDSITGKPSAFPPETHTHSQYMLTTSFKAVEGDQDYNTEHDTLDIKIDYSSAGFTKRPTFTAGATETVGVSFRTHIVEIQKTYAIFRVIRNSGYSMAGHITWSANGI